MYLNQIQSAVIIWLETPDADSKIKLGKQHEQLIEKSELKNAMAYGLVSSTAKSLRNMVNTISSVIIL